MNKLIILIILAISLFASLVNATHMYYNSYYSPSHRYYPSYSIYQEPYDYYYYYYSYNRPYYRPYHRPYYRRPFSFVSYSGFSFYPNNNNNMYY